MMRLMEERQQHEGAIAEYKQVGEPITMCVSSVIDVRSFSGVLWVVCGDTECPGMLTTWLSPQNSIYKLAFGGG